MLGTDGLCHYQLEGVERNILVHDVQGNEEIIALEFFDDVEVSLHSFSASVHQLGGDADVSGGSAVRSKGVGRVACARETKPRLF